MILSCLWRFWRRTEERSKRDRRREREIENRKAIIECGNNMPKPSIIGMSKELKTFARQGYVDVDKNRLFDTCYEQAGMFVNGLANVKDGRSGKWGLIDTNGNWVFMSPLLMEVRS